jgi:riboflavin synthase
MGETLRHSSLKSLSPGTLVNLERSVRLEDRLGGHLVQGHTDGTGTIQSRVSHTDWDVVRISLPADLARYVVHKGSITVDGISLTVSALSDLSPGGTTPPNPPAHGGHLPPIPPGGGQQPPISPGSAGGWFEVSLIPETLKRTTLGAKQPGDEVNLEVDVIAKYVEKLTTGGTR